MLSADEVILVTKRFNKRELPSESFRKRFSHVEYSEIWTLLLETQTQTSE
jgi:hypothetical protein